MKQFVSLCLGIFFAFNALAQDNVGYYGKKITADKAIPASELAAKVGNKKSINTKVEGTVESVCQMSGCWMKLKTADGKSMRVTFRDYGFFVPKDLTGKTVVVEGTAQTATTTVAALRHYAEDAGKSQEEIAKINEPERAVTFVADGVIVKN